MKRSALWRVCVAGMLVMAPAGWAQEDPEEGDIAFARAGQVWTVVEKAGGRQWDATWTLRPDGRTFDAHWRQTPGGAEGNLSAFARIKSVQGNRITIDRPGLGQYTGTLSADRTQISGKMSWASGTWHVSLDPATLPAPVTVPAGQHWTVVEVSGGSRWDAVWTLRADARSFDATWKRSPGGEQGKLTNFARIRSISGNQIVIDRPGLGVYTGTISAARDTVTGKMSWASGTWRVTVRPAKLPLSLH